MSEPYRVLPPMRVTSTASAVGSAIARQLSRNAVTETQTAAPRAAAPLYDSTDDEGWTPVPTPRPVAKPQPKTMTLGDLARMRAPATTESVEESVQDTRPVVLPGTSVSRTVSLVARMLGSRKR